MVVCNLADKDCKKEKYGCSHSEPHKWWAGCPRNIIQG